MNLIKKYNNLSEIAKATLWFFLCTILNKCISLITTPIFTRLLSSEQMGIYTTFNSWSQIVTIIITLRLDYSIFNKGMTTFSEEKNEYTSSMQSVTVFLSLLLLLVYLPFQKAINSITGLSTSLSICLILEAMLMASVSYWMIRQRYDFKYKPVISVTLGSSIIHTIFGVLSVLISNHSGIGRIIADIVVNTILGTIVFIIIFKNSKKAYSLAHIRFALAFNIPLMPHYFATYIMDQFDKIMIMKLIDYAAVGVYSIAYTSGYLIKMVTSSLNNTLIPWLYRQLKNNQLTSIVACLDSLSHCVMICFMGYMTCAPEIISIFAPEEYRGAVTVLPPVTASAFLIFLYELYANIEFFYKKNKFTMLVAIGGASLNIILNYMFIPIYGYVAAAYTTLICYCLFTVSHFIYVNYISRINNETPIFKLTSLFTRPLPVIVYSILINFVFNLPLLRVGLLVILLSYVLIFRKRLFAFFSLLK